MNRREFTKLTSLTALSLPYKNSFAGMIGLNHFQNEEDIKTRSIAAFKRFEEVWNFRDFWKRGNTFDACLTFADALHQKWPRDKEVADMQKRITEMLEENYHYFMSIDRASMW